MALWFLSLTAISVYRFAVHGGEVLAAINPWYIVRFFEHRGPNGWKVLGNVVLVVTGAEALYADMGHFSRSSMMVSGRLHCPLACTVPPYPYCPPACTAPCLYSTWATCRAHP